MPAQFAWFFLSFRGRISRQEFWLGYLFAFVVTLLLILLLKDVTVGLLRNANHIGRRDATWIGLMAGGVIASAIMMWPLLTLYVKRLHDCDLSGWWLVALFAVMVALDTAGLGPKNWSMVLVTAIGMVPGKHGDNRFGPDPIATRS